MKLVPREGKIMTTFGLDGKYAKAMKSKFDVDDILIDLGSDFFALPQFDVIYRHNATGLRDLVLQKLKNSAYGPRSPVEVEVPKVTRIASKRVSVIPPNYFRPGSVLWPEDRLVYHYLGQEASPLIEKAVNRAAVFSHVPSPSGKGGFVIASLQWDKLRKAFAKEVKKDKYNLVLKADLAHYFFNVNQHELVNQLEHQKFPPELARFLERFLSGLTLDRSSRGIAQGVYSSDVFGTGYLIATDSFLEDRKLPFFRYVDDYYILFTGIDQLRETFPGLVKKLRDYDQSFNERKTYVTAPKALLRQETELDEMIAVAKKEALANLTSYDEVEIEGEYDDTSYTELIESVPEDKEVELKATYKVFNALDSFQGEERDRAESFCLNIFRKASDPIALDYISKLWQSRPDRAREFVVYFNRFVGNSKTRKLFEKTIRDSAGQMIDFQWCWAALVLRRVIKLETETLDLVTKLQKDGSQHEAVRSLLTYAVCRHGTADRKKDVREAYANQPLLIQLAIIHSAQYFTGAERNAFLKTAAAHGDLQSVLCEAVKSEAKAASAKLKV